MVRHALHKSFYVFFCLPLLEEGSAFSDLESQAWSINPVAYKSPPHISPALYFVTVRVGRGSGGCYSSIQALSQATLASGWVWLMKEL